MTFSGVFVRLITGAFGAAITCWGLGFAYPMLDAGPLRQKLDAFAEDKDRYDTVFFGSSRVYHQISPDLYDTLTSEAGAATTSYNLGMDALFPPEDSYVAEVLAGMRPRNLKWAFVEVGMFLPELAEKNPDAARSIYWHDWKRTSMTVRDIVAQTDPFEWKRRKKRWERWRKSLDRCVLHLELFFKNEINLGRGAVAMRKVLLDEDVRRKGRSLEQRGFAPYPVLPMSRENEPDYQSLLALRKSTPVPYQPLSPVGQENLELLLASIEKAGATPILVVSPALGHVVFVPRKPMPYMYLDFSDVHAWPELYRKESRRDFGHLSASGAEIYTRYIAQAWNGKHGKVTVPAPAASGLDEKPATP